MRTKDLDVLSRFKKQRNKITSELRRAKRTYYNSIFLNKTRTDVLLKKLNSVLHEGRKVEKIAELTIDGEIKKGKSLANAFNNYFVDLVDSVHSFEASRYVKGIPDCQFLSQRMKRKSFKFLSASTSVKVLTSMTFK